MLKGRDDKPQKPLLRNNELKQESCPRADEASSSPQ